MPDTSTPKDPFASGPLEAIVAWSLGTLRPLFQWATVALGAATAASAIYLGGLATRNNDPMVAIFEALAILAGVFATTVALGKFREGAGLALATCALAIGGGAILSDPTLVSKYFNTRGQPVVYGTLFIREILKWRVAAGLIIGIGALVRVWSRNPKLSAWYLVRAAITGAPVLAALVALAVPSVRHTITDYVSNLGKAAAAVISIGGAIVGFFAGLALVSASGHCLIRSLEVGRLRNDGSIDPTPPGTSDAAPIAA